MEIVGIGIPGQCGQDVTADLGRRRCRRFSFFAIGEVPIQNAAEIGRGVLYVGAEPRMSVPSLVSSQPHVGVV